MDTASQQIVDVTMIEAGTPIEVTLNDSVIKKQFADGSIWIATGPNDNPGQITFTIGKTEGIDDIIAILFPESHKTENGSLTARRYTSPIGANRSQWQQAFLCRLVDPVTPTTQNLWVQGRVAVNSNLTKMFGADNSKISVVLSLIGGETLSNNRTVILTDGDPDSGLTIS